MELQILKYLEKELADVISLHSKALKGSTWHEYLGHKIEILNDIRANIDKMIDEKLNDMEKENAEKLN